MFDARPREGLRPALQFVVDVCVLADADLYHRVAGLRSGDIGAWARRTRRKGTWVDDHRFHLCTLPDGGKRCGRGQTPSPITTAQAEVIR